MRKFFDITRGAKPGQKKISEFFRETVTSNIDELSEHLEVDSGEADMHVDRK